MAFFSYSRKIRTDLLVGLVVGLLAVVLVRLRPTSGEDPPQRTPAPALARLFDRGELALFDALTAREAWATPASPEIVFARIDEEALAEARESAGAWPWPRGLLGRVLEELHALGARLLVVDDTFVDPDARGGGDGDARFAESLERAGPVVLGFGFASVPDESRPSLGRWAVLKGSYATRGAALAAAGAMLAREAHPYLVATPERVEVWLGGYKDRAAALEDAAGRLASQLALGGEGRESTVRELTAEETLSRVTREMLFAERVAVKVSGPQAFALRGTARILQPPVAALVASPARFGDVRLAPDDDGAVRSVRHLVKYEGRYYPSLALAAALALGSDAGEVTLAGGRLQAGALSVPVDASGMSLMRFYGLRRSGPAAGQSYAAVSVAEVLRSIARREAGRSIDRHLEEQVRGRIVFLAREGPGVERVATPLQREATSAVVAASALDGLMRSDALVRASVDFDSLIAVALALLGAALSLLFTRTAHPRRTLLLELGGAVAVVVGFLLWVARCHRGGEWVGAVIPMTAFLLSLAVATAASFADEHGTTQLIREALGRGAPSALVDQVLRNPAAFALDGDLRPMSVYLIDLVGFTAIRGQLAPRALVRLVREYATAVSEAVGAHRGQVDKLLGDAVMAWWGAPLRNARHALDACRAALAVREVLARRRDGWRERFGVEVRAGAGLESGEVVVGNLGPRGRRARANYSVLGEAVDLASRLEQSTRTYGVDIVIGEGCFEQVREAVEVRELDLVRVRGRQRPVRVFELMALKGGLTEEARAQVVRFEQALVRYRRREFAAALELLEPLAAERPGDAPVALYLERCRSYLASPPPVDWDGVFEAMRARAEVRPA